VSGETLLTVPLHHLTSIYLFGNASASFPLIARCAADGRTIASFDAGGRFQFRIVGPVCGNVLLRQAQYETHRSEAQATPIARAFVAGKIRNARQILVRLARDSKDAITAERLRLSGDGMAILLLSLPEQPDRDGIRGVGRSGRRPLVRDASPSADRTAHGVLVRHPDPQAAP
jgi:CRISPR-associated protein Cas1